MLRRMILPTVMLIALMGSMPAGSLSERLHFGLSKSMPAADTTVEAVTEIRLWFTEVPQDETVSIRLIDGSEEAVHTGEVTQDQDDDRAFSVVLHAPLSAGSYTVAWRGMGSDGHVVRETFVFSVAP